MALGARKLLMLFFSMFTYEDLELEANPYRVTPLHISAKFNSTDVCRLLIKKWR